jgi:glycosyltransferase involved in cell wall biosynthesis
LVHKLSILVPVYNEVQTAARLIRRVAAVRFPVEREIVVVDDGSSDGSRPLLERLAATGLIRLIAHEVNRGKGAAIQTALAHATGDIVVFQDADLELCPEDLPQLLAPILSGESRVCYGSRFLSRVSGAMRRRPTYWANRILNALSNLINGIKITDFNTCYKMLTTDVVRRIGITQSGFEMEPEITGKVARLGLTIAERPVHYEPRTFGAGKKIRLRDLFKYVVAMVRYRFFWSEGKATVLRAPRVEPEWASA